MWRRRVDEEPPISRDEVLVIMGALSDIKAWTWEILVAVKEGEDGQEDDA